MEGHPWAPVPRQPLRTVCPGTTDFGTFGSPALSGPCPAMGDRLERGRCTMRSGSHGLRRVSCNGSAQRPRARRLVLAELEARLQPATTFTQTNPISDVPGIARTPDPNLGNPRGP